MSSHTLAPFPLLMKQRAPLSLIFTSRLSNTLSKKQRNKGECFSMENERDPATENPNQNQNAVDDEPRQQQQPQSLWQSLRAFFAYCCCLRGSTSEHHQPGADPVANDSFLLTTGDLILKCLCSKWCFGKFAPENDDAALVTDDTFEVAEVTQRTGMLKSYPLGAAETYLKKKGTDASVFLCFTREDRHDADAAYGNEVAGTGADGIDVAGTGADRSVDAGTGSD